MVKHNLFNVFITEKSYVRTS